ncbi:MAG: cysteine--tRNA ligase [Candidatus Andersenbacteria bacterium]|nr:cysteine--tRNA ligase [Candidatus Andersenbacteria bacterium]
MPTIRLYNSLTRRVQALGRTEEAVRIYHCGPTVYKRPHLGNLRRFLFADFLGRGLDFLGYRVRQVMNITDVGHLSQDELEAGEDKLEMAARQQHLTPPQVAERVSAQFFADLSALHIKPADEYPRATDHIAEMQALISRLLRRGHAYKTSSGVYFDVRSWPKYGQLSGNTVETIEAGARVAIREEKRHPADFALWKINDPSHLQQWASPWGRGYPGWHIECSAMSMKYLGESIDIHTGGEDNKFPHHENEIAQSEGATGATFARFFLHNGLLRMAGVKLAKRAGELVTLDTVRERGYEPLAFRLLVFGCHYRSPLDFSWHAMDQATANLRAFRSLGRRLVEAAPNKSRAAEVEGDVTTRFGAALADDLNTPAALAGVMDYVRGVNSLLAGKPAPAQIGGVWATLTAFDQLLGIFRPLYDELLAETAPPAVIALTRQRETARAAADFVSADRLRQQIEQAGWLVEDTPAGPRLIKS